MAELIDIRLTRAALALADTSDYAQAAEALNVSEIEFREQIKLLEDRLCIRLFVTDAGKPVLTDEGRLLIQNVRGAISRVERRAGETEDENQNS